MFAASPSFLKMIRCDDDLVDMTILRKMVNFMEAVGILTSSTLFQLNSFFGWHPNKSDQSE